MKAVICLIGIGALFMGIAGCEIETASDPLSLPLILGKYVPKTANGDNEYVELNADSSYQYYYRDAVGNEHIYGGQYFLFLFKDDSCHCRLTFRDFARSPLMKYNCSPPSTVSDAIRKRMISYSVLIKKFDDSVFFSLCTNGERDFPFVKYLDDANDE